MDFKKLSNIDLFQAYQGYLKLEKTGVVGPDDFDGIFRRAIDECPGTYKVIATEKALLEEIASRWFAEHNQQASPLDHWPNWFANILTFPLFRWWMAKLLPKKEVFAGWEASASAILTKYTPARTAFTSSTTLVVTISRNA